MANSVLIVFVTVILLQIGTGKDIRWIKNTNWNNVDNWSLGRLPCKGDIASFSQVMPLSSQKPLIYFNTNATIRKLVLPRNGKIILKPSITIRLAENESCEISPNAIPIVATGGEVNNFVGVRGNKWECPENWAADDNTIIEHAPCGSDVPVFPSDSAFSYVTSEIEEISVESVLLRAKNQTNFDSYGNELLLNLSVNTGCQSNPNLCPCIKVDKDCSILASTALPTESFMVSTMLPTMTGSFVTMSSASSFSTVKPSASLSVSSMAPSTSLLTSSFAPSSLPGISHVGVTTSDNVPNPHTSGPIGPIASATSVNIPNPHTSGPIGPVATAGIKNNDDSGGVNIAVIGAIVGVIVLLVIVAIIIVVSIIIIARRRRYTVTKHKHLEEDDHAFAAKESGTAAYDNPAYECNLSIHSSDLDQMENPLF